MKFILNNKLFLLITLSLFIFTNAYSQRSRLIRNQGFYYTVEPTVGYGLNMKTDHVIDLSSFSPFNLGLKASANWFLNYHTSIGGSFGYMHYEEPTMTTFPLMASIKYYTGKPANTPFIYAEGGISLRTDNDSNHKQYKGIPCELGIGYRLKSNKKTNFLIFKLGYGYFKANKWRWELTRQGQAEGTNEYQWYYLTRHTINLSIGYYRSTRL